MSYLINNQQKLNDVIFANRNKAYGAYAIRSSYGETILKSLGIMIFGVGTLLSSAYYYTHKSQAIMAIDNIPIKDSVYIIPVYFPPEEIKKPEVITSIIPPMPTKPDVSSFSTHIVDSTQLAISDTSALVNTSSSTDTSLITQVPGVVANGSINSTNTHTSTTSNVKPPQVKGVLEVDTQPEYEGGLAALNRFIASQLRYPERASDAGQQGKVYVRFVVDEKGRVGDLMLLNSIGYGMDEEALRVVGLIPKFKTPAKVKGEAVKVYFQVPIKFNYR